MKSNSIFPCFLLNGKAQEAASFYCSIFPNSRMLSENQMAVSFELDGNKFMTLNGGEPDLKFSAASSYVITCTTQAEIDFYWDRLGEGGIYKQCGWLEDKYGVSWQVVPAMLEQLMSDKDKAPRIVPVFLQMKKFDIEALMSA